MIVFTYLYSSLTIDLHVRTAYEPPPEFPLASPYSSIVHHLLLIVRRRVRKINKRYVSKM